jgi:hypothetical protein
LPSPALYTLRTATASISARNGNRLAHLPVEDCPSLIQLNSRSHDKALTELLASHENQLPDAITGVFAFTDSVS